MDYTAEGSHGLCVNDVWKGWTFDFKPRTWPVVGSSMKHLNFKKQSDNHERHVLDMNTGSWVAITLEVNNLNLQKTLMANWVPSMFQPGQVSPWNQPWCWEADWWVIKHAADWCWDDTGKLIDSGKMLGSWLKWIDAGKLIFFFHISEDCSVWPVARQGIAASAARA